jgi:uncharacterized protein
MQTILISGGTGLVGTALSAHLAGRGYQVIILTRNKKDKENKEGIEYAEWDIKKSTIDLDALKKADYIIHLAGAGVVDKKWTAKYKQEIVDSRVDSSKLIIESLAQINHKVKAFLSASAIGWYGADKNKGFAFTEEDPAASNFLGRTCQLWEASVEPAKKLGIRVCKFRTGIVLSNGGGALAEFKKPFKFGVAAILGNGEQLISWIHIEDLCRMYRFAIENDNLHDSYNAVAPSPVTNKELTLALAKETKPGFYIPIHVPAFALKLVLGKRSEEVLKSTTVSCTKIKRAGFTFLFPSIKSALQDLSKK